MSATMGVGVASEQMLALPENQVSAGCTLDALAAVVAGDWHVRAEGPVTTRDSEPEPDVSVVRGRRRDYANRHPSPKEVALLVEVGDTSLERDRGWKKHIYAAAGIPCYWILNLIDGQVEVHTQPGEQADYAARQVYRRGDRIPVVLDGAQAGTVAVDDLLP